MLVTHAVSLNAVTDEWDCATWPRLLLQCVIVTLISLAIIAVANCFTFWEVNENWKYGYRFGNGLTILTVNNNNNCDYFSI